MKLKILPLLLASTMAALPVPAMAEADAGTFETSSNAVRNENDVLEGNFQPGGREDAGGALMGVMSGVPNMTGDLEMSENTEEEEEKKEEKEPASEKSSFWDGTEIDTDWYKNHVDAESFEISTPAELAGLAQLVNDGTTNFSKKTITLTSDIDLNNQEWTPIGGTNTGKKFAGIFDGGGYTISNLRITRGIENTAANNGIGLFGSGTGAAIIRNFSLKNVDVAGCLYVAAVLGGSEGAEAKITDVHVTGAVKVYGWWYVAGILGKGYSAVTNCSVEGISPEESYVQITGGYAGGIVGFMGEDGNKIEGCHVENITVSGMSNGIGGISGILHYGNTISGCTVKNTVVWQKSAPGNDGRIYVGAFAGTYLDNNGQKQPTLSGCNFSGELYYGAERIDCLEENRYVGSLWYGAKPPATVHIEDCSIQVPITVTFVYNDGTDKTESVKLNSGEAVQKLPEPSRSGYQFLGWFTEQDGGEQITADSIFTENTTVYASWKKKSSSSSSSSSSENTDSSSNTGTTTETTENKDGSTTTTVTKPDGTVTETTENKDGSTVTVVTKPDGTTTETTENKDGSKVVVEETKDGTVTTTETDKEGNKTETVETKDGAVTTTVEQIDGTTSKVTVDADGVTKTEVSVSKEAAKENEVVALPIPSVKVEKDASEAAAVEIEVKGDEATKVEIPVKNMTAGTVAVVIDEFGRETVVKTSLMGENGVVLTVDGSVTVKIVDNSKDFADVADSYWGSDAVQFAASRELFAGTGNNEFTPDGTMTRAMVWTVLARLDGVATGSGANWYAAGQNWAMEKGISDGTNLNGEVTREQLAAMLYRYAQMCGYDTSAQADLSKYTDVAGISEYAVEAMQWANAAGVVNGTSATTLDAQADSTRAQVATMLMNFCKNVVQ